MGKIERERASEREKYTSIVATSSNIFEIIIFAATQYRKLCGNSEAI